MANLTGAELVVGALRYDGWKSVRVTRSIESIAGSFAFDVTDRWSDDQAWPIAEEDACRVMLNGEVVIDGFVDKRSLSISKEARTLAFTGRDRAAALVDCSAIVQAGTVSKSKWSFANVDVAELAAKIAEPFDIPVSLQAGLKQVLTRDRKVVVHPGDTCFEVISRVAAAAGVLVVSDGKGGIVITRAGTERATSLIEGQNILTASVDYDAEARFHRYMISSQIPGTDESSGESTRVQAEAVDEGVRRTERVLLIRPDTGYNTADSRGRADWEARIRAARAEKVTVTVQGWRQPDGKLWPINKLTHVRSPGIGVDGDMLISEVEYSISEGGSITQLGLVRPDAFTPEPTAATVKSSGGGWKEIRHGAQPEPKGR